MKKHCHPKVRPISYNEYFNVGNRVLIDIEHKHCDHVHHDPIQVVKPEYPNKPICKPAPPCNPTPPCKPVSPCKPDHECDNIWTDDINNCHRPPQRPPHHHKPVCPPHCSHKLEDRDGDGFYEGGFICKH